jgi:hypothetical protein
MTDVADNRFRKPQLRPRPGAHGLSRLPLLAFAAAACFAVGLVVFLLWPRWPAGNLAPDAPTLPVTIAGVAFNLPPAAIRVPVQRRPGAHDRVDLAFLWPSLEPPDAHAKTTPTATDAPPQAMDRLFVTLSVASDRLTPAERVQAIYTRYVVQGATADSRGLLTLPFRDGSPYQGEDLIYEPPANPVQDGFLVRCTRNGPGPTPGICLHERRIERADVVVRFPRDWLDDWKTVAQQIDRLTTRLRPRS